MIERKTREIYSVGYGEAKEATFIKGENWKTYRPHLPIIYSQSPGLAAGLPFGGIVVIVVFA